MKSKQIIQILGSAVAILAVLPGARAAARHFDAYELIWLIPVVPSFTVTFFWIIIVMVGHFIAADSYKDPKAIGQAKTFLVYFEGLFFLAMVGFVVAGIFLHRYFS